MKDERKSTEASPALATGPAAGQGDRPGHRRAGPQPAAAAGAQRVTHAAIRDVELLADWLDSRFRVPGTTIRFGLDSLLGLVPGVGDAATTLPALYILLRAHRLGVPKKMLARMGWNVLLDLALGAIPVVGDLFDVGFKSNRRNVALLRQHVGQPPHTPRADPV